MLFLRWAGVEDVGLTSKQHSGNASSQLHVPIRVSLFSKSGFQSALGISAALTHPYRKRTLTPLVYKKWGGGWYGHFQRNARRSFTGFFSAVIHMIHKVGFSPFLHYNKDLRVRTQPKTKMSSVDSKKYNF